jgi:hypothetical protein
MIASSSLVIPDSFSAPKQNVVMLKEKKNILVIK